MGSLGRILFRPEVGIAPAVNQLDGELDIGTRSQQTALDQSIHAELPGDVDRGQIAAPVALCRLPGRHSKARDLREFGDQDVLQTVGVIGLFRIARQVAQR